MGISSRIWVCLKMGYTPQTALAQGKYGKHDGFWGSVFSGKLTYFRCVVIMIIIIIVLTAIKNISLFYIVLILAMVNFYAIGYSSRARY